MVEGFLTGQGTGHSVFSGRVVCDRSRGLDIQFLAVEVSVMGGWGMDI